MSGSQIFIIPQSHMNLSTCPMKSQVTDKPVTSKSVITQIPSSQLSKNNVPQPSKWG